MFRFLIALTLLVASDAYATRDARVFAMEDCLDGARTGDVLIGNGGERYTIVQNAEEEGLNNIFGPTQHIEEEFFPPEEEAFPLAISIDIQPPVIYREGPLVIYLLADGIESSSIRGETLYTTNFLFTFYFQNNIAFQF